VRKNLHFTIFTAILTLAVLLGAYLGFMRYRQEVQNRTVELVIDLNDLKKMAAYEKKPLSPILDQVRKLGISGIGVFEETLPDAGVMGEIYYADGSGIMREKDLIPAFSSLVKNNRIKAGRTYLYISEPAAKQRIYSQLRWAVGEGAIRFLTPNVIEVEEVESELRPLGLGISELQQKYLTEKGFWIIPRVWNDPHYNAKNMEAKVSGLKDFDCLIFDGEELLGYKDAIPDLASALKKYKIDYGYVEIVKQDGDNRLKKMMGRQTIRVHSVPKDELKKITKEEALDRFVRAVRERSVRLIYLRPFLPPQIEEPPVEYNLAYLEELTNKLEGAGYRLGKAEENGDFQLKGWQIVLLGAGVIIGALFLLNYFIILPLWFIYLVLVIGIFAMLLGGAAKQALLLQKYLAFTAALVFPSYAVIATFSKQWEKSFQNALYMVINILTETAIGIFLMIGLLADFRFMSGIETFPAVKIALILPVFIVGLYFLLKLGEGKLKERLLSFLDTKVSLLSVFAGLLVLGAMGVLIARSGNFVLPVPAFEKYFRNWLEMVLFIRPRTKEFLIGYPVLFAAAFYYLRGNKTWLWLLAAIGTIAPISVYNTFSHIHTPLIISFIRTLNALVLGILFGYIVWWVLNRLLPEKR